MPDIPFFYGRNDCGAPQFFMHEFCPIHDDAAPFFMEQFNLDPEEYTTLMGKFGGRGYTHPPYLLKKAADKLRLVIKFL